MRGIALPTAIAITNSAAQGRRDRSTALPTAIASADLSADQHLRSLCGECSSKAQCFLSETLSIVRIKGDDPKDLVTDNSTLASCARKCNEVAECRDFEYL